MIRFDIRDIHLVHGEYRYGYEAATYHEVEGVYEAATCHEAENVEEAATSYASQVTWRRPGGQSLPVAPATTTRPTPRRDDASSAGRCRADRDSLRTPAAHWRGESAGPREQANMAATTRRRKAAQAPTTSKTVRLNVAIPSEAWERLALHSTMTRRTQADIITELVETHLRSYRVQFIGPKESAEVAETAPVATPEVSTQATA